MVYKSTKPAAGDKLKVSQGDIQGNFADIKTAFDINHVALTGAGGNEGKHLYLQLPEHAAPSTAANEAGLSANVGAYSTVSELVFRRESDGVTIPFTEGLLNATGWSRFASGVLVKWGFSNVAASGSAAATVAITLPTGATIPPFSGAPYFVFLTMGIPNALIPNPGSIGAIPEWVFEDTTATVLKARIVSTTSIVGGWDAFRLFYCIIGPE